MAYSLRIGEESRTTKNVQKIQSPFDGKDVGEVCIGSDSDLDDAIAAASEAFEITRRMPTHERITILRRTASALEARSDEIAKLMTRESGKPIRFSRAEVSRAVITFELGAAELTRSRGEVLPVDLSEAGEGRLCLYERVPRGPVAAISPFNFPLNLVAHKVSPAIAVGASMVLKPPPQCPITSFVLAEILEEAGLPAGALNVVPCEPDVAQRMVEDDRLKVLSFTGSDTVGWKLKSLAGRKQVLLELGGNAPCIVEEDTDLDFCMPPILNGAWAHAGQVCIKVQRIFVHASRFDAFLERFVNESRDLATGDPMDDATIIGPLIEPKHVERVTEWIDEARQAGAVLHCGGEAKGNVLPPTILTNVDRDQRVCKDEVFGPVTVVESFDEFSDAIDACNASRFGLQAGIFTRDITKAMYAFRELDYGGVLINDVPTFRIDNFPYGGTKDSGFGREGVRFAMEEMTEPKVLLMRGLDA